MMKMGTNYYHSTEDKCPTCGHDRGEVLHIGKSSGGWCFALHVYPRQPDRPRDLDAWKARWQACGVIKDEYGAVHTPEEMIATIENRSHPWAGQSFDYERNHAQPGPNGLVRAKPDGVHCIGPGEGTWDYMVGDFS